MHIQITSTITQQIDKEHTASNKVKRKRKNSQCERKQESSGEKRQKSRKKK